MKCAAAPCSGSAARIEHLVNTRNLKILLEDLTRFPHANEFKVFLAMVHCNIEKSKQAVEALLSLLAERTIDEGILMYSRAIAFYPQDIGRASGGDA